MNLRQLRYFLAVAEEANIGRAAKRLHISQPPLTRQMHQLEADLGYPLFARTRRGIQLTNAGQVLREEAQNILTLAEQAKKKTQLAGQGRSGRIDIGVFGSNILGVSNLLLEFHRSHPNVDVVVHTMDKEAQVEALRDRRIAVGFNLLGSKLADIANETVRTEPLMVALGRGDALARRTRVALAELASRPMVLFASGPRPNLVDVIFALCLGEGFQPRVAQEVVDSVTAVALVAAGFGVCLIPQAASHVTLPNVVYRQLDAATPMTVDLNCIYRRDDQSPILHALLQRVREMRGGAAVPAARRRGGAR